MINAEGLGWTGGYAYLALIADIHDKCRVLLGDPNARFGSIVFLKIEGGACALTGMTSDTLIGIGFKILLHFLLLN